MSDRQSCLLCRVQAAKLTPEASAFCALVAAHKTSLGTVFETMCEEHSITALSVSIMVDAGVDEQKH